MQVPAELRTSHSAWTVPAAPCSSLSFTCSPDAAHRPDAGVAVLVDGVGLGLGLGLTLGRGLGLRLVTAGPHAASEPATHMRAPRGNAETLTRGGPGLRRAPPETGLPPRERAVRSCALSTRLVAASCRPAPPMRLVSTPELVVPAAASMGPPASC